MKRILAGTHAVTEALRASAGAVHVVYVAEGVRVDRLGELARERNVRVEERTPAELDALAEGLRHQGVVAITGDFPYRDLDGLLAEIEGPPFLLALDEITDPHNFGAMIRSAVALGAHGVLTLKDRAVPVTGAVVRAAAGATEHARIARVTNLARTLAELRDDRFLSVVGLAADGEHDIDRLPPAPQGRIIVVGSEGKGLRPLVRKQCTELARIPMTSAIGSLNASVAAAIALFATRPR
ncbi:MAG: 23S rRNA (guanosine(2251)-2'-O)-methyltransferase RlmB [Sandaracinus sp.]